MADWKKLLDDAVSTIGDGAKAAGEGLRELADDARKVAGIGRGRIEIVPDRARHRLGETIEGTVRLHLSEPVPARRLVVVLRARRKRNALGNLAARGRETGPSEETAFEFESTIAGEQTFEGGDHRFEIDLPLEVDAKVDAGGLFGDAMRAAKFVHGMTHGQLRWTLSAFLDIAWKRNLAASIDIAVRDGFADLEDEEPRREPTSTPTSTPTSRGGVGSS